MVKPSQQILVHSYSFADITTWDKYNNLLHSQCIHVVGRGIIFVDRGHWLQEQTTGKHNLGGIKMYLNTGSEHRCIQNNELDDIDSAMTVGSRP